MYRYLVWAFFASAPILAAALQTENFSAPNNDGIGPCIDGFRCNNGKCLPMGMHCNDIAECSLGEDEVGCGTEVSPCGESEHGCCFDGVTAATGPAQEGCDCASSQYGCCPHGETVAEGADHLGCSCNTTTHGCCSDGVTAATGPAQEGCDCASSQYGCCPDGETVAEGADHLGCSCNTTTHGCCSDGVTAATGPAQEGCDCASSQYGCCPDGVTKSQSENFTGCSDAPDNRQESCWLPRHHSVIYFCGGRECNEFEPSGTVASPLCKNMYRRNTTQYFSTLLDDMNCVSNQWSYIGTCQLDYSFVPEGNNLTLYIGKNVAVHISGSQYTVSLEDRSETISTLSTPLDGPNEIVSNDTVVVTSNDTIVETSNDTAVVTSNDTVVVKTDDTPVDTSKVTEVVSDTTPEPKSKTPSSHFNPKYFRNTTKVL